MPSIPLPFVISIVLGILLIRLVDRREPGSSGLAIIAFVGACALLSTMTGLRWSYDWAPAAYLQPALASTLPALAWLSFADLIRKDGRHALHALPAIAIALMALLWRQALDLALFALYIGYGTMLLWRGRRGSDALVRARLGEAPMAHRAMIFAGGSLVAAALIDATIAFDLFAMGGVHAVTIVAIANLVTLLLTAYCAALADRSRVPDAETSAAKGNDVPMAGWDGDGQGQDGDRDTVDAVDMLMRQRHLYRDPNLTLERIARRAGIPARQISGAINRVHHRNVSQFVNEYRVADAARRLVETEDPITTVMLESGFQTKSNFNREFLRVTGTTPSAYRRSATNGPAEATATAKEATSSGSA